MATQKKNESAPRPQAATNIPPPPPSAIEGVDRALAQARTRPFGDRPSMTYGAAAVEELKAQGWRIVKFKPFVQDHNGTECTIYGGTIEEEL